MDDDNACEGLDHLANASVTRKCASHPTSAQIEAMEADFAIRAVDAPVGARSSIPVWFHVITKGSGAANGDVSDAQLNEQLSILNAAYAAGGIGFTLAGTDRTVNNAWYTMTPGSVRRAAGQGDPAQGRQGATSTSTRQHRRRPARLGDLPRVVQRRPARRRRRHPHRLPPRRQRGALQPRRHRHPRGRPLGGPLPHVPGRLRQERDHRRRPRRRHARREVGRVRLSDRPRLLQEHRRQGPDHQLHGLHR
jgi:hypothetical protein